LQGYHPKIQTSLHYLSTYFHNKNVDKQTVKPFLRDDYLQQVLLSHDGSSYPQQGKSKRTFEVLFTTFLPMMKGAGFTDDEIRQLIVENPANAYSIKKRLI